MRWFFFLVIILMTSLSLIVAEAARVRVAKTKCGTTIPINSNWMDFPLLSSRRSLLGSILSRKTPKDSELIFTLAPINETVANIIVAETGLSLSSVVIFELLSQRGGAALNECMFFWNPLKTIIDTVEISAARVLVFDPFGFGAACQKGAQVELGVGKNMSHLLHASADARLMSSFSFLASVARWPLVMRLKSNCPVYLLLLTNQQGSINKLHVWLPAVVFTGAVVGLLTVAAVLFRRTSSPLLTTALMTLVFFGYFGSALGLVLEVLIWQSALGRIFPFPNTVIFYSCLVFLYLVLFALLLLRHVYRGILFNLVLRLAVYGMSCALCCGYWIAGYVLLGCLALVQFFLFNFFLLGAYSYFVIIFGRTQGDVKILPKVLGFLWFPLIVPFAPCTMMYFDLCIIDEMEHTPVGLARMVECVTTFNVLTSFPLLFLQNLWSVVLLAIAASYHMPLAVLFFAVLFLFVVHFIFLVGQYISEYNCLRASAENVNIGGRCSFCFNWCMLWILLKRRMRNVYCSQPSLQVYDTGRQLSSVTGGIDAPTRRAQSNLSTQHVEKAMSDGMQSFSVMTIGDNERCHRKESYWPASIEI